MKRVFILLLSIITLNCYAIGPYVKERPEYGEWQYLHTEARTPDYPGDKSAWIEYIDLKSIKSVGTTKVATVYVEFVSNDSKAVKYKWLNFYFVDCKGKSLVKDSGSYMSFTYLSNSEKSVFNFVCNWK